MANDEQRNVFSIKIYDNDIQNVAVFSDTGSTSIDTAPVCHAKNKKKKYAENDLKEQYHYPNHAEPRETEYNLFFRGKNYEFRVKSFKNTL